MKPADPKIVLPGSLLVLAATWTLAGPSPPRLDPHRTLGSPVQVENLTVWPVLTDDPVATGELLSLHEAQRKGLARVREKGSGGGGDATVNELVIENRSDRPVVAFAGTILKGGKQDRQLGQDIVLAAHTTVPVDAFCVERGRWSGERAGTATDGLFEIPEPMAAKRVRAAGHYEKNQSNVWRQVETVNEKARKVPQTSTFIATVEEEDRAALALRERIETTVRSYFAGLEGDAAVVGFAYSVNGEPLAARAFANAELLAAHFEPFLKTMSLEAQVTQVRDRAAGRKVFDQPASSEALVKMVQGIADAEPELHETGGLNKNETRTNDWGGHSSCLVRLPESGGRWVPVTEDWTAPAEFRGEVREELLRLRGLGYTE